MPPKATIRGFVQIKTKITIATQEENATKDKNVWRTYQCDFEVADRTLTVRSKDGKFVFKENVAVERAW